MLAITTFSAGLLVIEINIFLLQWLIAASFDHKNSLVNEYLLNK